jgi:DNA repair protein RadC
MTTYNKTTPEIKLRKKNGLMKTAKIQTSKDAEIFFREIFDETSLEVREQLMFIFLNNENNTVGYYLVSVGGITATLCDVRLLFRAAIECGATSLILAHNHPSGTLTPSEQDKILTQKVKNGGLHLDIRLLDHIILTADSYTSMGDEGLI